MQEIKTDTDIIYRGHLHWILFAWPVIIFCFGVFLSLKYPIMRLPSSLVMFFAFIWELIIWLTYQSSFLIIKKGHVILCNGIFVQQTLDLAMNKIESIDIRQSMIGTMFNYGSLVITGTGGTRQYINYLDRPLTCRRYIEQVQH